MQEPHYESKLLMTSDQRRRGIKNDHAKRTRFPVNRPVRFERNVVHVNKESNASSRNLLAEISSQRPNRSSLTRAQKRNIQEKVKLATNLPREKSSWYSSRDITHVSQRQSSRRVPHLPRLKIAHGLYSTAVREPRDKLAISRHQSTCCGVCTVAGLKPGNPRWQNQDSYIISEDFQRQTNQRCYAVLDGHGEIGHLVSKRCSQQLCGHFVKSQLDMSLAFRLMQQDLSQCELDIRCSGATCVFVHLHDRYLRVANIGDSRGVLGHVDGTNICATPLTSDQKPDRHDEQRRIVACGGQVSCRQLVVGHSSNGPITLPLGPPRVWYRRNNSHGDTMGLAMSRSFGDAIAHGLGVSCEPEITQYNLDSDDKFLIWFEFGGLLEMYY